MPKCMIDPPKLNWQERVAEAFKESWDEDFDYGHVDNLWKNEELTEGVHPIVAN